MCICISVYVKGLKWRLSCPLIIIILFALSASITFVQKYWHWMSSNAELQVQWSLLQTCPCGLWQANTFSLLLTSYQWPSLLLISSTHRGSDLEPISLSRRLSQVTVSSTFVTHCVAAMTDAWNTQAREMGHCQNTGNPCQCKAMFPYCAFV